MKTVVKIECPHCGVRLKLNSDKLNTSYRCSRCRKAFVPNTPEDLEEEAMELEELARRPAPRVGLKPKAAPKAQKNSSVSFAASVILAALVPIVLFGYFILTSKTPKPSTSSTAARENTVPTPPSTPSVQQTHSATNSVTTKDAHVASAHKESQDILLAPAEVPKPAAQKLPSVLARQDQAILLADTNEVPVEAPIPEQRKQKSAIDIGLESIGEAQNRTWELAWTYEGDEWTRGFTFSPGGSMVVVGGAHHTLLLLNAETGELIRVIDPTFSPSSLVFSSDDKVLAIANYKEKFVKLIRVEDGTVIDHLPQRGLPTEIIFNPKGEVFIIRCNNTVTEADCVLQQYSLPKKELLEELAGHKAPILDMDLSADGTTLVTSGGEGLIGIWKANEGVTFLNCREAAYNIDLSPNGRYLLTSGVKNTFRFWEVNSGSFKDMSAHEGTITALQFGPDSTIFATGSMDGKAMLWSLDKKRKPLLLFTIDGHSNGVSSLVFDATGKILVSRGSGRTVFWNTATGKKVQLEALEGPEAIRHLAFSPDGKMFAAQRPSQRNRTNTILLWRCQPAELAKIP